MVLGWHSVLSALANGLSWICTTAPPEAQDWNGDRFKFQVCHKARGVLVVSRQIWNWSSAFGSAQLMWVAVPVTPVWVYLKGHILFFVPMEGVLLTLPGFLWMQYERSTDPADILLEILLKLCLPWQESKWPVSVCAPNWSDVIPIRHKSYMVILAGCCSLLSENIS